MTLAVSIEGAGPPLALVHGWGLGPQVWQDVVAPLAQRFTVHVVALPGYGGSAASVAPGLDALADVLAASLPPNTALCGWSLGAMVALACAARHPEQVQRLILVAANGRFVRTAEWPEALAPALLDTFSRELESDAAMLLLRFAALVNHGDSQEREATRCLRRCLDAGPPAGVDCLRAGLQVLRNADPAALAGRVTQPTLFLHGRVDPLMPLAGAQRLASLLPNAKLQIFADAAHAPFASQPQEFVDRVLDFADSSSCVQ
jgi:pimeloyl-[acyl-carrier protein] methyl ester esterase